VAFEGGGRTCSRALAVRDEPAPTSRNRCAPSTTATHDKPAQARRERTDSCTVPSCGPRRGEAMVALSSRSRIARNSARSIDDCAAQSMRTSIGSGGRGNRPSPARVFAAHGSRQDDLAGKAGADLRLPAIDAGQADRARTPAALSPSTSPHGEAAFPQAEADVSARPLSRRTVAFIPARRRALDSERVRDALTVTPSSSSTSTARRLEPRAPGQRWSGPRANDRDEFEVPLRGTRSEVSACA